MDQERWAAARRELADCDDREDRWRQASGLTVGGDPSGVEPEHLVDHQYLASRVESAARLVVRVADSGSGCSITVEAAIASLRERLADLDRAWPEE